MYPAQCFYFDDFYLLRFGRYVTDVVKKGFFGSVDRRGCSAAQFFEAFDVHTEVLNESYRGATAAGLAFWLKPAASSTGAATWWDAERRRYNSVHAFNVHLARAAALTR